LRESDPADPWYESIRAQIEAMAWRAGQHRYTLPDRPAGPSAADIEAAATMSEAEQMEMIRSMVAGLNARLAAEGGPAEEWAQLIRAYGVLGDVAAATAIWREAQARFEGRESDLALLRAAAEAAGVAP
jgi:cytochrome c-type biogenesis protein CcmH